MMKKINDHTAILTPNNVHGISAQLPSPIKNELTNSPNGNTAKIYSSGGPHIGTLSSGRLCRKTWRPAIHAPTAENNKILTA